MITLAEKRQRRNAYMRTWRAKDGPAQQRHRIARQKWRIENPDNRRARDRELSYMKNSAMSTWKMERGCADCGYNKDPVALDFDHLDNKKYNIAHMRHHSIELIIEEMEKCEVVCANCHRIRTVDRKRS
jgi:hypothetical protein